MLIQLLGSYLIINLLSDSHPRALPSGKKVAGGGKSTAFQVQYSEWKDVITG
jgi:hypothetical protein